MQYGRYSLHYEKGNQVVVGERSGQRSDTEGDVSVNYYFRVVDVAVDNLQEALHTQREHKATLEYMETVVIIHEGENERNNHVEQEVVEFLEQNGFEVDV